LRRHLAKKKVQFLLNGGLGLVLLAVSVLSARHFLHQGWPLHRANYWLVGAAALLYLLAYAFKAWGWQRLFKEDDRPAAGALAFAGGAACVGGVALPGRFDDAVRIACVKRFPGTRAGLGTLGLSLIILAQAFGAAVQGVGLAALRLRTHALWPLIPLHALHDLFLQLGNLPIPLVEVPIDTVFLVYGIILLRRRSRVLTNSDQHGQQ